MPASQRWTDVSAEFSAHRMPHYLRRALVASTKSPEQLVLEAEVATERRLQMELDQAHTTAIRENEARQRHGNEIHLLS